MTINKVDNSNFPTFVKLIEALAIYEKITPPDAEAVKRLEKDCLSDIPKFEAYIGKVDEKPIGYIILLMTYSSFLAKPTVYIEDLFIHKVQGRLGYGQVFFDYVKKLAKERSCGRIEWTVLDWNTNAS